MFNAFFPQLWLFYLFILIFLRTFAPNKIKTFMNSKKRYMVIALLALLVVSAMAYNDEAKPWTFWNWKYGSVSRPGIHADLTGMKNVGMGGIWLMRYVKHYYPTLKSVKRLIRSLGMRMHCLYHPKTKGSVCVQ